MAEDYLNDRDKTARLSVLELQQKYTDRELSNLGTKVDRLSSTIEKLDNQLPMFVEGLTAVAQEFRSFKGELLQRNLENLQVEHEEALKATKEKSDLGAKVRIIWSVLGVIIGAIAVSLIRIVIARFSV